MHTFGEGADKLAKTDLISLSGKFGITNFLYTAFCSIETASVQV